MSAVQLVAWKRTPARRKARQLATHLRQERPDYAYLKEVFRQLRAELGIGVPRTPKRLPYVPTDEDIRRYYETVWQTRKPSDLVLIKTLLYTGVRVSELVDIRLVDVDFDRCQIRVNMGKGGKDRVVPFPSAFQETLALHHDRLRSEALATCSNHRGRSHTLPRRASPARALRHGRRTAAADLTAPAAPFFADLAEEAFVDDALIQPYSGHASRQSLEIYSRLAIADAQAAYAHAMGSVPGVGPLRAATLRLVVRPVLSKLLLTAGDERGQEGRFLITTDSSGGRCKSDLSWCMEEQRHPCGRDWSSTLQSGA